MSILSLTKLYGAQLASEKSINHCFSEGIKLYFLQLIPFNLICPILEIDVQT